MTSCKIFVKEILKFLFKCINSIYYLVYRPLMINSWTVQAGRWVKHRNFGDELNYFLIEQLTGRKCLTYQYVFKRLIKVNYMCIGSVLHHMDCKSVVWGAGTLFQWIKYESHPKQIYAVRGPLTRQMLLEQQIDCPPIYGDPALLLPLIYDKPQKKKYKLGIIPHRLDLKDTNIGALSTSSTIIIPMEGYSNWHTIIDMIRQCEVIASSSLHGLIVSDAYRVPNVWIKLSGKLEGGDFKFYDYMGGVNRDDSPLDYTESPIDIGEILLAAKLYHTIDFDPQPLLKACPFKLLPQYSLLK